MAQFHHGISKKEPASGIIPMRDAETNTVALLAFSDDADADVFPLDTPVLVTSINRALAASGTEGNLRASLETIAAITNPTLIVVRIADPFTTETFDQSKVIGTTLPTGERTGLQAFLTAKSILGLTPKIISLPDVESPDVVQALAVICKKLRAYSYITPRDELGVMLPTMEEVTAYRDTLGFREIEIVWPEFTGGNVFLGKKTSDVVLGCEGATSQITLGMMTNGGMYEVYVNEQLIENSTGLFEGRSDYDSIATILARDHNIQLTGLTADLSVSTDPYKNDIEIGRFKNLGSDYVKIGIKIMDANPITSQYPPLNPTFPGFSENYPVSFCLAPA